MSIVDASLTSPSTIVGHNRFFRSIKPEAKEALKRDYVVREMAAGSNHQLHPHQASGAGSSNSSGTKWLSTPMGIASQTKGHAKRGRPPGSGNKAIKMAEACPTASVADFMANVGVACKASSTGIRQQRRRIRLPESVKCESESPIKKPIMIRPDLPIMPNDGLKISQEERVAVLSFFNTASVEELALMPGCSRKTGEAVTKLRPFKHTLDIMQRLDATRHLSSSLVTAALDLLHQQVSLSRLLARCERIAFRMEQSAAEAHLLKDGALRLPSEEVLQHLREETRLARRRSRQQQAVSTSATTNGSGSEAMDSSPGNRLSEDRLVDEEEDIPRQDPAPFITQQPAILNPLWVFPYVLFIHYLCPFCC
ncbi:unnamed protein product [Protopolystoma xenopodis]|uniref:Uncharacterized protein n=1 Tax=Protopolystoma xenopodis TaxID=117903 RepID=A0A448WMJ5_9PLAT|nr:unnamed protein product [Protopolystoma xenopodis]